MTEPTPMVVRDTADIQQVPPLLDAQGLWKSFGGEHALIDADLTLAPGELRALVGANGSGKSTLIKILAGYHTADGGVIRVDGEEVRPMHTAGVEGFRFVHQDLALISELTVAENVTLVGAARHLQPVSDRRKAGLVQPWLDEYDLDFRASDLVGDLSASDRTMVAVVRAFHQSAGEMKALVLDEVTATLLPPEVEQLFTYIRRLPESGVSVIFVSHRLEEVLTLCDTVTVLRDGRVVAGKPISETNEQDLVELITGRTPQSLYPELPQSGRRPVLAIDHLAGGRHHDVSFELHEGEIVGLASLDPAEPSELLRLIYGAQQMSGGTLTLDGEQLRHRKDPHQMSELGVTLVTDRLEGGIGTLTLRENLTLNDVGSFFQHWLLRIRAERREARRLISDYQILPPAPEATFATLSGGNQQKAILAKSMRLNPRVVLLDDPTRGVDIGAKALLFDTVRKAAGEGLAVLMTSTEPAELCGLCHRVVVLKGGRNCGVIDGDALTPDNILERCYLGTSRAEAANGAAS